MNLYDDATVATTDPGVPAAGTQGPGYFTDGTPGTTPATTIRGWWLNGMAKELLAVIAAGGLTPARATFTQVRDAINVLIANAIAGLANVYQPKGNYQPAGNYQAAGNYQPAGSYLTTAAMQRGSGSIASTGTTVASFNVTFPTPFAAAPGFVSATLQGSADATKGVNPVATCRNVTATGMTVEIDTDSASASTPVYLTQAVPFVWLAVA